MEKRKKIFAVSDIHGFYTEMLEALTEAGFDRDNPEHLLVAIGDYFDRGTENKKVLQFFERLQNKVLLRGNHEDMLLSICNTGVFKPNNYLNGTVQTVSEFFGKYALDPETNTVDFSGRTSELERVCEFMNGTENYFETKNFVFTHGWLPTTVRDDCTVIAEDWRKASDEAWQKARWTKWNEMYDVCNRLPQKTIVCGHVPSFYAAKFDRNRAADDSSIFYGDGVTAIDAGTYSSGRVNVFVIEDELIK